MKLNKIFMALAATAMVGCSSEDLSDFSAKQAPEDARMIQLDQNFALAGVGVEDATTRTHWDWAGAAGKSALINQFLPILDAVPGGGTLDTYVDAEAQAVGLCWLGQGAVGTDVYTNYQFYHFGWLATGATEPEFDCGDLTNGAWYDEIDVAAGTPGVGDEADPADFSWNAAVVKTFPVTALNYNSGVYKTDNKAIFGGEYIVYYPFNEDFKEAGTIPAIADTQFGDGVLTTVATDLKDPEVGHATFRYSAPVTIEGGDQAAGFGLYNLSSLVQLRVALPAGAAAGPNIDQIVLYSPSQKLLKQANLAADKIAAGQKGTDLYTETEGTKTIVANFVTGTGVTLLATDATAPAPTSAYITVLPTTVPDLVALVHDCTNGKWATVDLGEQTFKAGGAKRLDIPVTVAGFKKEYIAVDEVSFRTAVNEASLAGSAATINVIGDITLDPTQSPYNYNTAAYKDITVTGDAIIIPEGVVLRSSMNFESDIFVLGTSCCSGAANGGRLFVAKDGMVSNVTMEPSEAKVVTLAKNPKVTFNGASTVAAGSMFDAQAGEVVVNNAVKFKGDINIAEDVTLTVNAGGDLNFMGGTVVNDGTIEVMKGGMFDMTDANGNSTVTDGQRMTNNGVFIHNVDAGVGTAVQSMNQNGEYRCRVDEQIKLSDAYLQWKACSVIEMVNPAAYSYDLGVGKGVSYKHNGEFIDIEVNAGGLTTFDNPTPDNENIQIGDLSVLAGGLNVDFVNTVGTKPTGKRTLTVNGEMLVEANTRFVDSKEITIAEYLYISGATLTYTAANGKLAVTKDIELYGGLFDASAVDALNITCANFKLNFGATAQFGNRTDGASINMTVTGTISNPAGCTFDIIAANQNGAGSVLAWVTCKELLVGGTFTNARPRVE